MAYTNQGDEGVLRSTGHVEFALGLLGSVKHHPDGAERRTPLRRKRGTQLQRRERVSFFVLMVQVPVERLRDVGGIRAVHGGSHPDHSAYQLCIMAGGSGVPLVTTGVRRFDHLWDVEISSSFTHISSHTKQGGGVIIE